MHLCIREVTEDTVMAPFYLNFLHISLYFSANFDSRSYLTPPCQGQQVEKIVTQAHEHRLDPHPRNSCHISMPSTEGPLHH